MKQIWLIPLDGSENSLRPITWAIDNVANLKETPHIHLLNVQPSLPHDIGRFIAAETIRDFHRENGMNALAKAHSQLKAAGLTAEQHVLVGDAAPTIVEFAKSRDCHQIIMGTRGHSGLAGILLGSVSMRVAQLATMPLQLVS